MNPARFSFDGTTSVPGFSDGTTWNGFACPLFTAEQIPTVIGLLATLGYAVTVDHETLSVYDRSSGEQYLLALETIGGVTYWRVDCGLTWNESELTVNDAMAESLATENEVTMPWSEENENELNSYCEFRDGLLFTGFDEDGAAFQVRLVKS